MSAAELRAGRRRVAISSPDKLLFPGAKLTKLDLARYYAEIAPAMLPHVRGRPLALHGFPGGVDGPGFYMKNVPKHFPDWVERETLAKRDGTVTHALAQDAATLAYLAGQNVITLHAWLSRVGDLRRPDRLIFDFDPSTTRFAEVRAAARAVGELLRDIGLAPHAMTSGSKGLHVTVPLRRSHSFEEVHEFAREVGAVLVEQDPKRLTMEFHKAKRGDRIYVDTNRNAYAQHAVAPYSVRALTKAPVAAPLRWEELSDRRLGSQRFTVKNIRERLESEGGDPWKGIGGRARSLAPARKRLAARA